MIYIIWLHLKSLCWVKEVRNKRVHVVWVHLNEINLMYNDKRQTNCCLARASKENFWSDRNDSIGAYVDEWSINTHQTMPLKWVYFVLCKLYLIKVDLKMKWLISILMFNIDREEKYETGKKIKMLSQLMLFRSWVILDKRSNLSVP